MPGTGKPLAFLDVDGVINRNVTSDVAKRRGYLSKSLPSVPFLWGDDVVHIDPCDKELIELLSEHFDFAWGTTWEQYAPNMLSPLLGFGANWEVAVNNSASASKALGIKECANGRPFVWFDDDATVEDELFLQDVVHMIVHVNSVFVDASNPSVETGLTLDHIAIAIDFAQSLKS